MADDAPQSAEEMAVSLAEYKEQLAQVEALLAADPANAEFLDVKASLEEVIALTENLVATAAAPPTSAPPPPPPPPPAPAPESAAHFAALDTSVDGAACQVRRGGEAGGVWVDAVMRGALHDGRIRVTLVGGGGGGGDDAPRVSNAITDDGEVERARAARGGSSDASSSPGEDDLMPRASGRAPSSEPRGATTTGGAPDAPTRATLRQGLAGGAADVIGANPRARDAGLCARRDRCPPTRAEHPDDRWFAPAKSGECRREKKN
jgi:hypothetical protein